MIYNFARKSVITVMILEKKQKYSKRHIKRNGAIKIELNWAI